MRSQFRGEIDVLIRVVKPVNTPQEGAIVQQQVVQISRQIYEQDSDNNR
jgi:hypothetical protein